MEINEEHFSDWPHFFYETPEYEERNAYLSAYLKRHPDSEEDQAREKLLCERYANVDKKTIDRYMEAFLMLKMTNEKTNLLTRKQTERDIKNYYRVLGVMDADPSIPPALRLLEWEHFTKCYLTTCQSGAYRATIFGMLPMKDETLSKKIIADLEKVGLILPEVFALSELCKPFYNSMLSVYQKSFHGL